MNYSHVIVESGGGDQLGWVLVYMGLDSVGGKSRFTVGCSTYPTIEPFCKHLLGSS